MIQQNKEQKRDPLVEGLESLKDLETKLWDVQKDLEHAEEKYVSTFKSAKDRAQQCAVRLGEIRARLDEAAVDGTIAIVGESE